MWNEYDRPHADLREAIERLERAGELRRIRGADWKLEMGTLAEIVYREASPPAILFEDIPGYPKGFRAFSGATNSAKRLAILLGFPVPSHPLDVVRAYRDRMKTHKPIPPRVVKDGPVLENINQNQHRRSEVPGAAAPRARRRTLHRHRRPRDHARPGRGLGQLRHLPLEGAGPQPRQPVDLAGEARQADPREVLERGQAVPGLISCGHDPLLFLAGGNEIRYGLSEYDYAGGHRGAPYDVDRERAHRLPMPAHAEIVLEGEMHPGETAPEGPFGEFTGYYAGGPQRAAVVRVERIYHRNDPDPRHRLPDGAAVGLLATPSA